MRIGLSFASLVNKGGIGRYTRLLAQGLPRLFPEHSYLGYVPSFRLEKTTEVLQRERIEGWELRIVQAMNRWGFETSALAPSIAGDSLDIFHGPDYLAPKASCPVCVTVHDLAFQLHPVGMDLKSIILFRSLGPAGISRAASTGVVFSDSRSTLNDLRKLRWVGQEQGVVVPLACEDEFREPVSEEEIQELIEKYEIPRFYILYVGPIERRKNLGVLVHAYRLAAQVLLRRGLEVPPLLAAGPLGWRGGSLKKELENRGDGLFVYMGYLPRKELRVLYAGCRIFCYPSRYEGFGLPPLEAMSQGRAVVAANASSLPEVVGSAGILVDPDDVPGWSTAILRLFTNESFRIERETACRERSLEFSVDKMCRETMAGYEIAVRRAK